MLFLWIWICFAGICRDVLSQGQVSGNAMDLASMNMNMMNTKCKLQSCQSVCLVKEQESGCFVCDPACGSGGIPESNPGMVMPMQPIGGGQGSFFAGCQEMTWMQCPMACTRKFDNGCLKCVCPTTGPVYRATSTQQPKTRPATSEQQTTATTTTTTAAATTTTTTETTTKSSSTTFKLLTSALSITPAERSKLSTAVSAISTVFALKNAVVEPTASWVPTRVKLPVDDNTPVVSHGQTEENTNRTKISSEKLVSDQNQPNGFAANNLSFILIGFILGLLIIVSVVFLAWRRSLGKLRKNKDELYFVHKAYRQDSQARLPSNEMMDDPVYASIGSRPKPPPRSSAHGRDPTAPARTLSQTSDTPLKEHSDDCKHDYLELI